MVYGTPTDLLNAVQVALLLCIIAILTYVRGELNTRIREREERERLIRVQIESTDALRTAIEGARAHEKAPSGS